MKKILKNQLEFINFISFAFSFALVIVIGYLYFMPSETGLIQYKDEIFWVYFISFFFIVVTILTLILFKPIIFVISELLEILTSISIIIFLISYIKFNLNEPWIIQSAYFLRSAGIEFGFIFGLIILKSAVQVAKYSESSTRNNEILILMMEIILVGLFFILFIYLYRHVSIFSFLIIISGIQFIITILNIIKLNKDKINNFSKIILFYKDLFSKTNKFKGYSQLKERINQISNAIGTDSNQLWRLWKGIKIAFIFNMIGMISYITGIYFNPYNAVPYSEVLSAVAVIIMFFQLLFMMFNNSKAQQKKKMQNRPKIYFSFFIIIKFCKFIGVFLSFVFLMYFHTWPMYFPDVILKNYIFLILGAIIYFSILNIVKIFNSKAIIFAELLMFLIALTMFIINITLLYEDGWSVGFVLYGYVTHDFFTYFPYTYLHSIQYSIITGISMGFLISSILKEYFIDSIDRDKKQFNIIALLFITFTTCASSILLNFLLNNPGTAIIPFEPMFNYFVFAIKLGIYLLLGGGFVELLIRIINHYRNKSEENVVDNETSAKNNLKQSLTSIRLDYKINKKIIYAFTLIGVIFLNISFIGVPIAYNQNYTPPMSAYSYKEYAIWPENSAERFSDETQFNAKKYYEIKPVELYLAGNEYGAVQFIWKTFNTKTILKNYSISDFIHIDSPSEIINSSNCSLRKVRFYVFDEFPEILDTIDTSDQNGIELNSHNVFWFDVRTPYKAKSGMYNGTLKFEFEINSIQKITEINIQINIYNFSIPNMRHIRTVMGDHHYKDNPIIENFRIHRMNDRGFVVSMSYDSISKTYSIDWVDFDNQMQERLEAGFNAFDISYGCGMDRDPDPNDQDYIDKLQAYLSAIQSHCEGKSYNGIPWMKYLFWYFLDEYTLFIPDHYASKYEYFNNLAFIMSKMMEAAPDLQIMTTGYAKKDNEVLKPYISIYCPVTPDYIRPIWDQYISEGKQFWFYTCVQPFAPMPNFHLYNRLHEIRVLDWQLWRYGCVGYLGWGSDYPKHGGGGPGHNGWGDGWFQYYENGNILDSIRWENFLDGQEDYEYLWLLNASIFNAVKNGKITENQGNTLKQEMSQIISTVTLDYWDYSEDPQSIYNARTQIAEMIEDMASLVDLESISEAPWMHGI